jgi:NADPH2:quinone reductase
VHIGRLGSKSAALRPQLEEVFRLYHGGQVKPVIGKTFPLAEATAAHRYIHHRQNTGKVVLLVS